MVTDREAWHAAVVGDGEEHSLALLFFEIGMKTLFPFLWPLLNFPNLLAY